MDQSHKKKVSDIFNIWHPEIKTKSPSTVSVQSTQVLFVDTVQSTLLLLDAIDRTIVRVIDDSNFTKPCAPLSHRHAVPITRCFIDNFMALSLTALSHIPAAEQVSWRDSWDCGSPTVYNGASNIRSGSIWSQLHTKCLSALDYSAVGYLSWDSQSASPQVLME